MTTDITFQALTNECISYLRSQPEQAANLHNIVAALSARARVISINSYLYRDMWGRPLTVRDGTAYQVLHRLEDHKVVERVREGRGVMWALTAESTWQEPTW